MTREEAIKALTIQLEYWEQLKEKNVLTDHEGNNVVDVLKTAIEALKIEIVRCKDCFMKEECKAREFYGDNGYCSIGER